MSIANKNLNNKQFSSNDSSSDKSVCKLFLITPNHQVYGYEICSSSDMNSPKIPANMASHLVLFYQILRDYTNAQFGLKNLQFCSTNC